MKTALILITSLLLVTLSFGQEKDWRLYGSEQSLQQEKEIPTGTESDDSIAKTPGNITVIKNNSLDTLLLTLQNNPPVLKGFRVRIYMGTSRDNADEVRSVYLKNEFQWQHYLTFKDPNFGVEIGDFMTRLQAEKVKEELTARFPNPYIVLTVIKPPDYATENPDSN